MPPELDYDAVLDLAECIARTAGAILRQYYEAPPSAASKSTQIDLVTEADRASERYIIPALHEAFPDHHIVGEEGGGAGPARERTPYHWYVDPLDGTTNFAHRFPVFSVSLSLSDPDLNPILGVIYNPMGNETYKAIRGRGAWVNGRRLRVSQVADLSGALVVTGFPYDAWTAEDNNAERVGHFVRRVQGVRRIGSAALDLCSVAAGQCDVYWERGPSPWDVQAGLLCVEEAGGTISDFEGAYSHDALSGARIVASNGLLHDQALEVIQHGDAAPRPRSRD